MTTTTVIKRNGKKEEYSVKKLKKVIQWCSEGLNVNSLELESTISDFIHEGMSTVDIHESIIYHAQSLATHEATDWVIVAGRGETMKIWKESKFKENNFNDFFWHMIETGKYHADHFKKYSKSEVEELSSLIISKNDLNHSYGSVLTAKNKYLMKDETIQYMHMGNAMAIASVENESRRMDFAKEVYKALSERKISLATPWLSSLRSGGNISSCFIIGVEDSMESITKNWERAAFISKGGGGLAIDLARVRAKGAPVNGRPDSSGGVIGWAKIFNDIAVSVDQGGKRAGAFSIHVPIWHRDVEDYLEIQSEVGDQRSKAHDIFPQIGIYDVYMELQQAGKDWHTFCPYEVETKLGHQLYNLFGDDFKNAYFDCVAAFKSGILKNVGVYSEDKGSSARDLLKVAMRSHFETGLPYIAFLDTINEANPNKHEGNIPCVNLCTESYSVVVPDKYGHTCNLASTVVGRLESIEEIVYISSLTLHILDNGIHLTKSPNDINTHHNERYRTVGTGIQGLHDYLAINNTGYGNLPMIAELTEAIAYGCVKKSVELAKERGAYPAFKGSRWDTGEQINQYKTHSQGNFDWDSLQEQIDLYGIRNSQTMSPAPNTSTSIFMDAGAGVMPVYAAFFREDNNDGKFPVSAMHLQTNPLGYAKSFNEFNQLDLVEAVAAMQHFIDTGISAEFLFDLNKDNEDYHSAYELYKLINLAWEKKLKAIYYIRSIKKGTTVEDLMGITDAACVGCAG